MRDYGKVHTSFWTSANVRSMSEDGRTLALYLLTCPHGTIAGVFRLPNGYICDDIQWEPERVTKGFVELLANGFANRCETTKWVWIAKHFEWNPPENPNQKKSAAKVASLIPDECVWKQVYMRDSAEILGIESPLKPNPSATLSEPLPNQEQEQEQEQEQDKTLSPTALPTPPKKPAKVDPLPCPINLIVDLYHEHLPNNPRCRVLNDARKATIRQRWREAARMDAAPFGYDSQPVGLSAWAEFFKTCADSDFLTGRTVAGPNRIPFVADLDFLMSPSGFVKTLDNKYHRETA